MLELAELPAPDTELVYEGKTVGRITSAAAVDGGAVALAYVRREVPEDARLELAVVSAPGMIRTCDLCLRRAALYPLSYGRSETA